MNSFDKTPTPAENRSGSNFNSSSPELKKDELDSNYEAFSESDPHKPGSQLTPESIVELSHKESLVDSKASQASENAIDNQLSSISDLDQACEFVASLKRGDLSPHQLRLRINRCREKVDLSLGP